MPQKNMLAIEIGTCNTKLVIGRQEDNTIIIEKTIMLDTPVGCQRDGALLTASKEFDQLVINITGALQHEKIKTRDVIFTIQGTSVIRRELEMPRVKTNDLESMIKIEIEQYLPIDLSEYIIEYKVQEDNGENGENMRVLIASMPGEIAKQYIELAERLSLNPKVMDINSNAISKLFSKMQLINNQSYNIEKTYAFLDIGCSTINITIVSGGLFQFSRLIPYGGSELSEAVAEAHGVSPREAHVKIDSEADLRNISEPGDVSSILRDIVFRWSDDIKRVFQYYKTRNAKNNIDEIYLYGGMSRLHGLEEYLSDIMSTPVSRIKTLSSIKMDKHNDKANIELFLNAIGAIIRK